jgi:hypothetical protein
MFATIVVILPPTYAGGQPHAPHATTSEAFDYSSTSGYATTPLAWYTDVVHEVKPITSGFRLALSYNLIHTSQGIPRPVLPDMHSALAELRSVLKKWSEGAYATSSYMIAYLLKHEYSQHNLQMGALKSHAEHRTKIRTIMTARDIWVMYSICCFFSTCRHWLTKFIVRELVRSSIVSCVSTEFDRT